MMEFLYKLGQKFAGLLGEKTEFGAPPFSKKSHEYTDQKALVTLLPYDAYDPDTHIFFNKNSQGWIIEAAPLTGASEETVNILASIITDVLPKDVHLQFLLWGSNKIGEILDQFEAKRRGQGDMFEWLAKKRVDFLKKGSQQSLTSQGSFLIRDIRLFIVVSKPSRYDVDHSHELVQLREDIMSSLKSIQMPTAALDINEFISIMTDWLHPSSDVYPARTQWNPHEALSLQLSDQEYQVKVHDDALSFDSENESWQARCLSVHEYPSSMTQWKMTDSLGQLFNTSLQMPCPYLMSFCIHPVDTEKARLQTQMKFMNKEKLAKSPLAKFVPSITREYEEWSHVRMRLSEGDKLVETVMQVILFSKTTDASSNERKIRDLYRANGWKLKKTRFLQLQSFLSALPMLMSEGLFQDMKLMGRVHTVTAFNAVNIAPIQGEWKGTSSPNLILPGRRGQIAIWNPFDNKEGNFNIAIAAASGKGKSAFTQEYIVSQLGSGGRVWVIDVGRSYEKTCEFCNGIFVEFGKDITISLNPFTHIADFDEALTLLKPLLSAMARPNGKVTDEEITYLEKALKAAWEEQQNQATITTVAHWLSKQDDNVCRNLANLLYSFTKDGMYGRYFEGPSTIHFDNPFVVLELQELKAKKDLQRIVMLVLMYHISTIMYLGERSQQKSCIIDEAWDLFGGENDGAAQFIETGYRTARRFNANFITIVQSVNDYFKNGMSIASFENSDTKIILGQTAEAIDQLKKSERLSIDAYIERLLKSLRKTDEYSECIIITPSGISVHRIIYDPVALTLYSSKGEEFEALKRLKSQGYTIQQAVEKFAEKFQHV